MGRELVIMDAKNMIQDNNNNNSKQQQQQQLVHKKVKLARKALSPMHVTGHSF